MKMNLEEDSVSEYVVLIHRSMVRIMQDRDIICFIVLFVIVEYLSRNESSR
jgi:hypothetical protein